MMLHLNTYCVTRDGLVWSPDWNFNIDALTQCWSSKCTILIVFADHNSIP